MTKELQVNILEDRLEKLEKWKDLATPLLERYSSYLKWKMRSYGAGMDAHALHKAEEAISIIEIILLGEE